jgi:uncharacterized RDD family membrane protein YckC
VLLLLPPTMSGGLRTTLVVICSAIVIGWVIFVCYLLAMRAASPGLRAMKLHLVGFLDGRPIGLARVVVRALVFWALFVTGIGLLIMLITELRHPRKQGWHDLAATAVMIKERVLAPPVQPTRAAASVQQGPPAQVSNGSQHLQPNGARAPMSPGYGGGEGYGSPGGPVPPGQLTPPPGMGHPTGPPSYVPAGAPPGGPDSPYGGNAYATPHPGTPSAPPQQSAPGGEMYAPGQHGQHEQQADPVAKASNRSPSGGTPSYEAIRSGADLEDHTSVAAPPSEYIQDWSILLDDGRRIALDGLVLLGRNPQPKAGEEDAQLIKIADETRTVSKSHLAVGVDGDGVYVVDRGSTNGSTVSTTNGMSTRCKAGELVRVGEGAIVSIGDHWLEITRGS